MPAVGHGAASLAFSPDPGRVSAKICGVTDQAALDAAISGGADFVGFVFFPPSPRALDPDAASPLAAHAGDAIRRVGLFVDPSDAELDRVLDRVALDVLQLHGRESPERCRELRRHPGLPLIKALPVSTAEDLAAAGPYWDVADILLFDARPPKGATRPGGLGQSFDWRLLAGIRNPDRAMVAGGLSAGNVARALAESGLRAVDCSSGVESAPGVKDPTRVLDFLRALA